MLLTDFITFYTPKLTIILALVFAALLIRQCVILLGQNWIKTFAHTATIMLLPIITYTITSVIAGDIALSLGLVGALSIVRFRNPVKSPFELAIYFLMITFGIAASVGETWLLFLLISVVTVLLGFYLVNISLKKFNLKPFYTTSFAEGNRLNILEIVSKNPLDDIANHSALVNFTYTDAQITYRLASHDTESLRLLANQLSAIKTVIRVDLNIA